MSPLPGAERNRTILASWTYGLGRTVAFTTDVGARYATTWTGWENYDKFFTQMIVWSMRPLGDEGKFTVSTEEKDGQIEVVVNALDKNDEFRNFLSMTGTVVGPNLETGRTEDGTDRPWPIPGGRSPVATLAATSCS